MPVNYTNLTLSNDITGFLRFGNDVTNGTFGPILLGMVFLVVFIAMKPYYPAQKVYAAAIYVTMLWGVALRILGAINDFWIISLVILTAVASLILAFSN